MSEIRKIQDGKCYFVSFSTIKWVKIFLMDELAKIMIDSIRYYQANRNLTVNAYCIMPNHVHMIASAGKGNLGLILRDMKRYTSIAIIKSMLDRPQDSIAKCYLQIFREAAVTSKRHTNFCLWQNTNYPTELFSKRVIHQKVNYIHRNPVKAGLVDREDKYRLSSACADSPIATIALI